MPGVRTTPVMSRVLLVGDLHLASQGPASRKDDWEETCFWKLGQVKAYAEQHGVSAVVMAGDIFHSLRVGYGVVRRCVEWGLSMPCPVLTVPGNHDERHERVDSVPDNPLGIVFASGGMVDVSGRVVEVAGAISVGGIAYPAARDLDSYHGVGRPVHRYGVLVAHGFASEEGGEVFGEPSVAYRDLADVPFPVVFFGHDHSFGGVARVVGCHGPRLFVRTGALLRGSVAADQLTHQPVVALVEFGEDEPVITMLPIQHLPPEEVFDLEKRTRIVEERAAVDQFLTHLTEGRDVGLSNLSSKLEALEVSAEVRTRVLAYLASAETS